MKSFFLLILIFLSGSLYAQQLRIDESKAEIRFEFIDDQVEGAIEGFDFTGNIDLSDLNNSNISGSVETKTLDTNNWLRSRHLRSKKYFSAKAHPRLSFRSNLISGNWNSFTSRGDLTIKGITQTITFKFKNNGGSLQGTATLNTQDFDISIYDERERNRVNIEIILPYSK